MKNLSLKTIFVVTLTVAILLSMTLLASAAEYKVRATYITADTIEYEATATGLDVGSEATYFAQYTGWEYFNQVTVTEEDDSGNGTGKVVFKYRGPAETPDSTFGTSDTVVKFGDEINVGSDVATKATKDGITVKVDIGGTKEDVVVPYQDENVEPTRYIKLEEETIDKAHLTGQVIIGVEYTEEGNTEGKVHKEHSIGSNVIVLENSSVIEKDGTLTVATTPVETVNIKVDFEYYTCYNYIRANEPDIATIDFLSKCVAPENYEYGILIIQDDDGVSKSTVEAKVEGADGILVDASVEDPENLVSGKVLVFKATAKNNAGEYAVTIENIGRYLNAGTYQVYAYIKTDTDYEIDGTPNGEGEYNTNKFTLDASGKCVRVNE